MINQLSHLLMHAGMITVFVITMMLIIDMVNVKTDGKLQERLKKAWFGQHLLGAILGIVPGCLGTFTIVSMYMHRILRVGAVVTTMIATSGDEAFVMFALFPRQALYLTLLLFVVGMVSGMLTDFFLGRMGPPRGCCDTEFAVHGHHSNEKLAFSNIKSKITSITLPFLVLLSVALLFSFTTLWQMIHKGANIENSIWLTVMLTLLGVTLFSTPHFLRQHLWEHIAKRWHVQATEGVAVVSLLQPLVRCSFMQDV
ncbi:hypothetical protein KJ865_05500 [Myxococcota bacterium]|nr:hypothetical protein [Myxococcota bacterium]